MTLNRREKLLLILVLVFGILLVTKSTLEGYQLTEETSSCEKAFYHWASEKQTEEYDSTLYQKNIFSIKLISIKERQQDGEVYYVGKFRKYFLKVIPFSDVFIKEEKNKFVECSPLEET